MEKLNYKSAGVDIDAGNAFVTRIKSLTAHKKNPQLLGGIGGFGALYELPSGYQQPVLVSSTDGVGTKLKLAIELNCHDTIGIDLVAMCVNDILVCGAKPLFFLDYFATGKLNVEQGEQILQGIIAGCEQGQMSLIGGETAEMPGLYHADDYDLAGFAVGVVEKNAMIDGSKIRPGHKIIGLASSGAHANGYSLIRHILATKHIPLDSPFGDATLGRALLTPTKIYVSAISVLQTKVPILGLAHITGGGLLENIPRILPAGVAVCLYKNQWPRNDVLHWVQVEGEIADSEMQRTFNCGIGMVLCLENQHVNTALEILNSSGEQAFVIGEIKCASTQQESVVIV